MTTELAAGNQDRERTSNGVGKVHRERLISEMGGRWCAGACMGMLSLREPVRFRWLQHDGTTLST